MYGLGQRISKHRGCEVIEHSGEIPGFLSRISRLPAHNVGLGILTNSDPGGKYLRAYVKCRLIEEFTGLEKVNWLDIIESKRQEQLVRASKWLDWFGTHIPSEREHAPTREINNVDIDPLTGTWEKDGFDKWTITSENLVRELPILETLPFIPSLYGSVRYFFSPSPDPTPTPHLKSSSDSTPAGEGGWYDACIAWTPGSASTSTCTTAEDKESLLGGCESKSASLGSELYGAPFKVRLADENRLEVYGLMGVGEGLTEDDHSITFHRVV
nr:uncharacterized protein I303_04179 [Kwoniella dejecticola CBS 10117]OBR84858.1 hypothetical protein I303_04179 [Kwoniella dejecticola CBS 10117]